MGNVWVFSGRLLFGLLLEKKSSERKIKKIIMTKRKWSLAYKKVSIVIIPKDFHRNSIVNMVKQNVTKNNSRFGKRIKNRDSCSPFLSASRSGTKGLGACGALPRLAVLLPFAGQYSHLCALLLSHGCPCLARIRLLMPIFCLRFLCLE